MQATIHTMFVNEKIIRIYSFCQFSPHKTNTVLEIYDNKTAVTLL